VHIIDVNIRTAFRFKAWVASIDGPFICIQIPQFSGHGRVRVILASPSTTSARCRTTTAINYVARPQGIQRCLDIAQVMNIMTYDIVAMATISQLDADKLSVFQRSTVRVAAMIDLKAPDRDSCRKRLDDTTSDHLRTSIAIADRLAGVGGPVKFENLFLAHGSMYFAITRPRC